MDQTLIYVNNKEPLRCVPRPPRSHVKSSITATAGFLRLYGSTVNGVANVVIRNNSAQLLTLQATQTGTMGVVLSNATNNIINIDGTGGVTISSTISESAAGNKLTKGGAGTGILTLSGLNTYTGVTTIGTGTLSINTFSNGGVAGSLGMSTNASANLVMTGGTLSYSGITTTTDRGLTLNGASILTVATATTNLNIGGIVTGSGSLTKGGGGTLTLSGANTGTGKTFVSGGTLAINSIKNVSGGASSLGNPTTMANGTIAIGTTTTTTTLSYIGTGDTADRVIDLVGTTGGAILNQSGTGLLKFTSPFAATGLGSKTLTLQGSTVGTGEIGGAIVNTLSYTGATATSTKRFTMATGGNGAFDVTTGATALTLSGVIDGSGTLTKSGLGTLTLSGTNTYSGGTTLNQGTLTIGTGGTLGATTGALAVNNNNSTAAGTAAILNLATAVDTTTGSLSGTLATPTSDTNTATINTQTGRNFTVNQTTSDTYAGVIAGAGSFTLGSLSTNTLTLTGNNTTYTGVTTVSAGTLNINGTLGAGANVVNANGGATNFGVSQTLAALVIADGAVVTLGATPPAPAPFDSEGMFAQQGEILGGGATQVVPEPGSAALLLGGLATLLGVRRRRA